MLKLGELLLFLYLRIFPLFVQQFRRIIISLLLLLEINQVIELFLVFYAVGLIRLFD